MNVDTSVLHLFPALQWHFDASGYYAYVMVNGSDADAKSVGQALAQHKVKTILLGRSYRPADDGQQYDWYLRVATMKTGGNPSKIQIEQALGIASSPIAQTKVLEDARVEIESLQHELAKAHQDLLDAQKQSASIRAQVEIAKSVEADLRRSNHGMKRLYEKSQNESYRFQEYAHGLEQQLNVLADEIDRLWEVRDSEVTTISIQLSEEHAKASATVAALTNQLDALRTQHAALVLNFDAQQQEWFQADDAIQEARSTIQSLTNERDIAFAEKECAEEERDEIAVEMQNYQAKVNGAPSAANVGELKRWLEVLLPNVILTQASFSQLHNEIRDPVEVFRHLEQLNSKPESVRGDNLEGKDKAGWVELHFNTGESNLGRLYFYSIGNSRFRVHIGHKSTQMHDFGQLKAVKRDIGVQRTSERRPVL